LKTVEAQSRNPIAFIICGALAREILALVKQNNWPVDVYGIPAIDHMYPERIAPDVERRFRVIGESYQHVLVVFADCGSRGKLDEFLEANQLDRLDGPHCYEIYGGNLFSELMEEEPGTFFLTDFLVRGFRGTIWRGLGLDRFPQLKEDYFRNYKRLVYISQSQDEDLLAKAQEIASTLELPLAVHHTGLGLLNDRLKEWMDRHAP
jgi:hypothetical protein